MTLRTTTDSLMVDLEHLVRLESPSNNAEALSALCEVVVQLAERDGTAVTRLDLGGSLGLLLGDRDAPVLLVGHLDTVHQVGSLEKNPWKISGDKVSGPGTLDMKSGVVLGLAALANGANAALLLTSDEETGSVRSQSTIEAMSVGRRAVLVLEASVEDHLKTARKGVARFTVTCTGRAAHAGLEPEQGVNALLAAATIAIAGARLGDEAFETSVTPTLCSAGTTVNTVPDEASLTFDVRAWKDAEFERVELGLRHAAPALADLAVRVERSSYRPPFEPHHSAWLMQLARRVASELGQGELNGRAVGGGSDGNFTAALGIATLDGLGGVGGGAHSNHEWISRSALVPRLELLLGIVHELVEQ